MHQPYLQKHNFLRRSRHSIPIGFCAGVVALLLGLVSVSKVDAVACSILPDMPSGYTVKEINGVCETVPILTTPTEHAVPTVSLSIDDSGTAIYDKVVAEYGKVNYSEHTVKLSAKDITDYTMTLSEVKMSGPEALVGAEGVKGAGLADNSWGYGWGNIDTTSEELSYESMESKNLTGDGVSGGEVDFARKLVFATKFNEEATAGTYRVSANLSVVATPASVMYVPWDEMKYMQDMSPEACESVAIGTEATLTDIRDNSTYTVAKLADGKCWMTQNLRITGDSIKVGLNKTITGYDSNVNMDYAMPIPTTGVFSDAKSDGYYTNQQVRVHEDDGYGAYYSYNVATANTVAAVSSGLAIYDICPKGWRLPTGGKGGEFQALYNKGKSGWTTNNGKNGYWIGGVDAASGAAFFTDAGLVGTGGLGVGNSGYYWSSTIYDASFAYYLSFSSRSVVDPASGSSFNTRYCGYSVRCVVR